MTTTFATRFFRHIYLSTGTAFFFVLFYFFPREFSWNILLQGFSQATFYLTLVHSITLMGLVDTLLGYATTSRKPYFLKLLALWFILFIGLYIVKRPVFQFFNL